MENLQHRHALRLRAIDHPLQPLDECGEAFRLEVRPMLERLLHVDDDEGGFHWAVLSEAGLSGTGGHLRPGAGGLQARFRTASGQKRTSHSTHTCPRSWTPWCGGN